MSRHFSRLVFSSLALLLFSLVGASPAAAQTAALDSIPSGAAMLQSLRVKEQTMFGPAGHFVTDRVLRGSRFKVTVTGRITHPDFRKSILFRERTRYYRSGSVYRQARYYTSGTRAPLLEVWTLNNHVVYASYLDRDGNRQRVSNGRLISRTQYAVVR
ncbi:MAG: hypothetical protein AVDCRST_MAG56-8105 [uncultured Cytophagales bacterium]|uniref:Uncharacterized protein n=1 Tax=uncultured Cytophagales bacterium TaxID=158755 RepID=A0A6J4LY85_9SPHI|nr:MAG: hypothetical protein AVDCRST_MAG56-8105 [uncultured Cytophagales bacterium]